MMIDTTKPDSLILVWMTLTFIQGHNYMRKQEFLHSVLDEIWYAAVTSWCVFAHAKFCSHDSHSREKTQLEGFKKKCLRWAGVRILMN